MLWECLQARIILVREKDILSRSDQEQKESATKQDSIKRLHSVAEGLVKSVPRSVWTSPEADESSRTAAVIAALICYTVGELDKAAALVDFDPSTAGKRSNESATKNVVALAQINLVEGTLIKYLIAEKKSDEGLKSRTSADAQAVLKDALDIWDTSNVLQLVAEELTGHICDDCGAPGKLDENEIDLYNHAIVAVLDVAQPQASNLENDKHDNNRLLRFLIALESLCICHSKSKGNPLLSHLGWWADESILNVRQAIVRAYSTLIRIQAITVSEQQQPITEGKRDVIQHLARLKLEWSRKSQLAQLQQAQQDYAEELAKLDDNASRQSRLELFLRTAMGNWRFVCSSNQWIQYEDAEWIKQQVGKDTIKVRTSQVILNMRRLITYSSSKDSRQALTTRFTSYDTSLYCT